MRYRSMIASQPESVSRCLNAARAQVEAIDPTPFAAGLIAVTGIGASFAASVVVAGELVRRGRRAVAMRSVDLVADGNVADSIIALSHRGHSVEVVDALKAHPSTPALAITNNAQSPLATAAGQHLRIANESDATPSSTGYTGTLAAAGVLIDRLIGTAMTDWDKLPLMAAEVLEQAAQKMPRLGELFRGRRAIDCVGARSSLGTAEEASLLLREAARIPAAATDTRNFLHGPMEAMDAATGVVLFGNGRELLLGEQLREIGCPVLLVTAIEEPDDEGALTVVRVPRQENRICRGIIDILSAQLLAAELSDAAGLTDTKFRYRQTDTKIVQS
jgi:glucosamine--fructose-6-phosphate aminotransferase (isomerizing)